MAVTKLDQVKVPMKLNHNARAIVTKDGILKNRNEELQALLGRIKELLGEDEVLIIAQNDTFGEATRRPPTKSATQAKDVDPDFLEKLRKEMGYTTIPAPVYTTTYVPTYRGTAADVYTYGTLNTGYGLQGVFNNNQERTALRTDVAGNTATP